MVLGNWLKRFEARLKMTFRFRRRRPRLRKRWLRSGFSTRAAEVLEVRQLLNATVTIVANQPNAAEPNGGPATTGQFTLSRTGDPSQPLSVTLTIGGNATDGISYTTISSGRNPISPPRSGVRFERTDPFEET